MLKEKIKLLPEKPGCYIFKNNANEILYVGKAKNIRKRVSQYFVKTNLSPKTKILVSKISDIDFQIVANEIDSLILESNLINKYEPKYNIRIKNSWTYPYIKINNKIPLEIKLTRKIVKDNSTYYGPYPDGYFANKILAILHELYPITKCLSPNSGKKCLNYEIGKCMGYCFKKIIMHDFEIILNEINSFLSGDSESIYKKLLEKINLYSKNLNFEAAEKIKNLLGGLKHIREKQQLIFKNNISIDIIGINSQDELLSFNIQHIRFGSYFSSSNLMFEYHEINSQDEISQILIQFYNVNTKPKFIKIDDSFIFVHQVLNLPEYKLEKRTQNQLLTNSNLQAKEKIISEGKIHKLKNERNSLALENFRNEIQMANLTEIEMIDISSLQGSNQVGVVVNFLNGNSNKNKYRKYNIESVKTMDDYKAIYEITYKHYWRKLMNSEQMPNLLIVDGKNQIKSAIKALDELKINIMVVGLKKNLKHQTESLILNNGKEIKLNSKRSEMLNLLSRFQDEVHRFAINFHNQSRTKNILTTSLNKFNFLTSDEINNLYKNFENIRKIKISSFDDVSKIIGKHKTKKLFDKLEIEMK